LSGSRDRLALPEVRVALAANRRLSGMDTDGRAARDAKNLRIFTVLPRLAIGRRWHCVCD
jgi:hypothetical protein